MHCLAAPCRSKGCTLATDHVMLKLTSVLDTCTHVYQCQVLKAAILAETHPDVGELHITVSTTMFMKPLKGLQSVSAFTCSSWLGPLVQPGTQMGGLDKGWG